VIDTAESVSLEEAVLSALGRVNDPELDESLVELGFVDSIRVNGQRADIVLRLPTFWCAPNFAYLMAVDAREETLQVPGVQEVNVVLKDHMFGDEISTGVSAGQAFTNVFPGQTEGDDLGALRALFRGKAFGMRQEQLVRFLLEAGLTALEIVSLREVDVVNTTDTGGLRLVVNGHERLLRGGAPLARAYLERRRRVGLDTDKHSTLITDLDGAPIAAEDLEAHLQRTRRQRISMTFNALMCRGLLETRYGLDGEKEAHSRADESGTTLRV
jgi:metal-sulfur cluster biosynthetic enzyme